MSYHSLRLHAQNPHQRWILREAPAAAGAFAAHIFRFHHLPPPQRPLPLQSDLGWSQRRLERLLPAVTTKLRRAHPESGRQRLRLQYTSTPGAVPSLSARLQLMVRPNCGRES